jgi:diaminohydroxyphosphoribosylaminopyrimidine deaminase/5-amino-6-(5-phosphoribosylamino)uracil reductase
MRGMTRPESISASLVNRAIGLAMQGRGRVEPNPMVGCVIVKGGRIIGEGYHQKFGGPHAEPNALAACTESPAGATAYVTLEPCCHTNKKTPPCVPKLIEAKVAKVVVGAIDPNPPVAGRGVEQLRAAGVQVDVLELSEARQLIAPFVTTTIHHRPYITLKWAQSSDGKIAGPPGQRLWISNRASLQVVHRLRAMCDAILVGMNTVLCDDPLLTVRGLEPLRPLRRVVLNRELTISPTSRIVQSADQGPVQIICSGEVYRSKAEAVESLTRLGVEVTGLPTNLSGQLDLQHVVRHLGTRGVTHLLVEAGPSLAGGFISENLADRIWIFRSPNPINDPLAPSAFEVAYPETGTSSLEGDTLSEYLNPQSPVYFSLDRSAEFRLLA